ncbi:hypothetical protein ABM061_15830, partial [Morganella morganii]
MMKKYHNKNHFISLSVMSFLMAGTSFSVMADDYYPASLFNIPGSNSQLTNEDVNVFKENDNAPGKYKVLMNPLMILVKIIKLRWIHILSYDQMVSRKINNQTTRCANSIF